MRVTYVDHARSLHNVVLLKLETSKCRFEYGYILVMLLASPPIKLFSHNIVIASQSYTVSVSLSFLLLCFIFIKPLPLNISWLLSPNHIIACCVSPSYPAEIGLIYSAIYVICALFCIGKNRIAACQKRRAGFKKRRAGFKKRACGDEDEYSMGRTR